MDTNKTFTFGLHGIELIEKVVLRSNPPADNKYSFDIKSQSIFEDKGSVIVIFSSIEIFIHEGKEKVASFLTGVGFAFTNFPQGTGGYSQNNCDIYYTWHYFF